MHVVWSQLIKTGTQELIKWSVADMRYMKSYFGVIKQSMLELQCFFVLILVSCCCFFCEDLATLTLYHTAHERSQPCAKLRLLSLLFSCISHKDEYTDACSNTSLTTSCSVLYTLRRISVNAVVTSCIFRELMWLSLPYFSELCVYRMRLRSKR